jgi:hypothetical protein
VDQQFAFLQAKSQPTVSHPRLAIRPAKLAYFWVQFCPFSSSGTGLNDLAHLLLGSVDVELRRERQAGWLRLYREEMARWAKQLGSVVPIDSEELAQRIFQKVSLRNYYSIIMVFT